MYPKKPHSLFYWSFVACNLRCPWAKPLRKLMGSTEQSIRFWESQCMAGLCGHSLATVVIGNFGWVTKKSSQSKNTLLAYPFMGNHVVKSIMLITQTTTPLFKCPLCLKVRCRHSNPLWCDQDVLRDMDYFHNDGDIWMKVRTFHHHPSERAELPVRLGKHQDQLDTYQRPRD